jgi:hypothetical protein
MIKIVLFFLVFSLLHHSSSAQSPPPVDHKKLSEQINEKLKAAMEQSQKMSQQPVNVPDKKPAALKPDNRVLPVKNNALLSQLPKKTLTRNELSAYLNALREMMDK